MQEIASLQGQDNSGEYAHKDDWVEIWQEILTSGERAPQIPSDTQAVPLEMRVRGFLLEERAQAGEKVRIKTRIGREVKGRLVDLSPSYAHSFGRPQLELLQIREEMRTLLRDQ
ncbi:2-amino-4-oxopentanoate thiolase subunit OrtA [Paradesulfitobacterium ferrireducens]|uniref:2-amino-4-oxopentanoate thiolase subunit OrtA n=1 Tax=Paradesulfitobacterium ferrireducens TaxID=2816476 RepID=UPI001A8DD0B8|nr:2-amino-4-oxopentanoate thiolase subunit OrtA [Paradesulfitobacterium ferrireducens]